MAVSRFPKRPVPVQVKRTGLGCVVKGAMGLVVVFIGLVALGATVGSDWKQQDAAWQEEVRRQEGSAADREAYRALRREMDAVAAAALAEVLRGVPAGYSGAASASPPLAAPATKSEDCASHLAIFDAYIRGNKIWKEEERTGMPHTTNSDGTPQAWADRQAIGSALVARKPAGCEL